MIWAVKHKAIGDAFFDYDAAEFLKAELDRRCAGVTDELASSLEGELAPQEENLERAVCKVQYQEISGMMLYV